MYKRLNQNDLRKEAMNGAQWPVKRKEKKCCHLIERAYYEIIVRAGNDIFFYIVKVQIQQSYETPWWPGSPTQLLILLLARDLDKILTKHWQR